MPGEASDSSYADTLNNAHSVINKHHSNHLSPWKLINRELVQSCSMPIQKIRKKREPKWKEWDQLAQKEGLRAPITSVNGDIYTGEWKDDKKHGRCVYNNCSLTRRNYCH